MAVNAERGGAIMFLFIAVALFGALGYAFLQSSRNSTTMMTSEAAKATAYQSQDCSNAVNMATKRLQARGCGAMISTLADGSNTSPGAPTDGSCSIYHPNGGGVKPCSALATAPSIGKKVFVTSTTYTGNLGGVSGADAKCAARATAASLPGTFKAWISDGTTAPASTFAQATQSYRLVDNTQIADDWADLTDGSLYAPINKDEFGAPAVSIGNRVWTNVQVTGIRFYPSGTNIHCTGWTYGSGSATYGVTGMFIVSGGSWSAAEDRACNETYPLYCFQQ